MRNIKATTKLLSLILVLSMIIPFALPMMSVSAASAYDIIYAKTFDEAASKNGLDKAWEKQSNRIGSFWAPGYMVFRSIDFGSTGPAVASVTAGARPDASLATAVEIRIDAPDGPLIATVPFEPVNFSVPSTGMAAVTELVTGVHDVYVTPDKQTINFYSFQFFAPEEPRLSYTSYTEGGVFEGIDDTDLARDVDLLWQLGMLDGETGDKFDKDMAVSRAEFAKSIYGIFTDIRAAEEAAKDPLAPEKQPIDTGFYDVAGDSEYAEAIAYLSQNGIMNGVGDGMFQPDYYIEKLDAITVLIRAIGYKRMAEESGGYPNGYINVATKLKLIKSSFAGDDLLTFGEFVDLLVNGLEADYLTPEIITDEYIKYTSIGGVLLDTQNIKAGEGKVTATVASTLALPESGLLQSEVLIDGVRYEIGRTNAAALLGVECDFYYEDGDDVKTLRAIVPSSSTEITYITSMDDEIRTIADDKIEYVPAGDEDEEEIEIASDAAILYNGVSAEKKISAIVDYPNTFTGFITVIENDGDDSQTILIEEYQDVIIESVDEDLTGVVAHKTTDVATRRHIDWDNESIVILEDIFGEEVKLTDLKAGDLYTVFASKNATGKKFVRMYKGQSELIGKVDRVEEGKIYVNGTEYNISNSMTAPKIGQEAKFLINMYGEIVKAEKADSDTWKIGLYLGKKAQNDGFKTSVEIKLMKTDGKIEEFALADAVTVDGVRQTDAAVICAALDTVTKTLTDAGADYDNDISAILYRTNAEGKIAGIDIATTDTTAKAEPGNSLLQLWKDSDGVWKDEDKDCLHWHRNLLTVTEWDTGGLGRIKWRMPREAQAFAFYGDDREGGCSVGTAYSVIGGNDYKVWGTLYSTNGDKRVADLVIWNRHVMIGNSTPAGFIYKSSAQGVDADGDPILIIKGWSGGSDVEYKLDLNEKYPVFGGDLDGTLAKINLLKPGDVVKLRAYSNNYINRFMSALCFNDGSKTRETLNATRYIGSEYKTAKLSSEQYILGKVMEREKDYMVLQHTDGTQQTLPLDGAICSVDAREDGAEIIGTSKSDKIEVGDWIFILLVEGAIDSMVLYKNWN